jgi:chemotaxis methyl-accepting protein methylase
LTKPIADRGDLEPVIESIAFWGRESNRMNAHLLARKIKKAGGNLWQRLPSGLQEQPPARYLNRWIHSLSRKFSSRKQSHMAPTTTRFRRYPPLLLTITDLIDSLPHGDTVRLCVMGCSTGAELYSVLWVLRKARADLKLLATGIDLSASAVEKAKAGRYLTKDKELSGLPEKFWPELFDIGQSELTIKQPLRKGIEWVVGDVRDNGLRAQLGVQDIVVANNFLIFMKEREAANCLRNIVKLVKPGGLLLCRGVDLDVRERVAEQFQLEPISLRIEELHEINVRERRGWPWEYWGLEPLDKTRKDWVRRYATIFQVPCSTNEPAVMSLR